jgi:hypothetical protein
MPDSSHIRQSAEARRSTAIAREKLGETMSVQGEAFGQVMSNTDWSTYFILDALASIKQELENVSERLNELEGR